MDYPGTTLQVNLHDRFEVRAGTGVDRYWGSQYELAMGRLRNPCDHADMSKRVLAAILWFVAGWYLGASIALYLGVSESMGPIVGLLAAGFFGGDPLGIIWTKNVEPATVTSLDLENLPDDLEQAA